MFFRKRYASGVLCFHAISGFIFPHARHAVFSRSCTEAHACRLSGYGRRKILYSATALDAIRLLKLLTIQYNIIRRKPCTVNSIKPIQGKSCPLSLWQNECKKVRHARLMQVPAPNGDSVSERFISRQSAVSTVIHYIMANTTVIREGERWPDMEKTFISAGTVATKDDM